MYEEEEEEEEEIIRDVNRLVSSPLPLPSYPNIFFPLPLSFFTFSSSYHFVKGGGGGEGRGGGLTHGTVNTLLSSPCVSLLLLLLLLLLFMGRYFTCILHILTELSLNSVTFYCTVLTLRFLYHHSSTYLTSST